MLSFLADISGILSCICSVFFFIMSRSIFKNIKQQKSIYNSERIDLQSTLISLRENILDDCIDNMHLRSELRQSLYSYQHKYWNILSPVCIYHIRKSIKTSKNKIPKDKIEDLCISLDYLVAYLDKKEVDINEH